MRPNGIIIAIDGPTASGKSTTAREVAARLGYKHLNSGGMYRAFALYLLQWEADPKDESRRKALLERVYIDIDDEGRILLEGKDVSEEIERPDVAQMASTIAVNPDVRERMVSLQTEIAKDGGYVVDGRDIGTVVFPDAEVKVYLTATPQVRAIRRHKDILEDDSATKIGDIVRQIEERDKRDMERENSPLRKAKDAVELDTSNLTFEAQVDFIANLAKERIGEEIHEG